MEHENNSKIIVNQAVEGRWGQQYECFKKQIRKLTISPDQST